MNRSLQLIAVSLAAFFLFGTGSKVYSAAVKAKPPVSPAAISIDDAVAIALKNNHEYRIVLEKTKQAKEKVNQVWGQLLPVLESEASIVRQGADNGFMSLSDGQYDLKLLQVRFGINPGVFYHSLQASHRAHRIAKEELRRVRSVVSYNVIKSYFDVILSHEMVRLNEYSLQVLNENLKDVKRLYQTGSVPKFELLQARVQLKNREPEYLKAKNDYQTALDMFNYHEGSDAIQYTVKEADLLFARVKAPGKKSIIPQLVNLAMKHRPEVLQLMFHKEGAAHVKKIHQAAYLWPTFSVGGSYGFTYLLPNSIDTGGGGPDLSQMTGKRQWQDTWQVRVAATYRWGDFLPVSTSRAREREEKAKLKEAELGLVQLKRMTAIAIRIYFGRLKTAYETILSSKQNIETAREGLRIARESYRAGVIKNADLLNAELSLTRARTGHISAVYSYYVSKAELEKEMGIEKSALVFMEDTNEK